MMSPQPPQLPTAVPPPNDASNGAAIAGFISSINTAAIPENVFDAARMCFADWLAVAIGARLEEPARVVHQAMRAWCTDGAATLLLGGRATPAVAALANGTLAHCLDFDDTHVKSVTHTSAPVWAATLALGEACGGNEQQMLRAFIAGFETAARTGLGFGEAATARGWHGTGVFGRLGATAAASALLRLSADQTLHALGTGATQTSGLTASFGTMAKPFHAGKVAMDGILAAQLAAAGFHAATGLLEPGGGLQTAIVQDRSVAFQPVALDRWQILENSFKPYAACHLTHPAVDAARGLIAVIRPQDIAAITAHVFPLAEQITGRREGMPQTGLAGKFDIRYCIAAALHGQTLSARDFADPWQPDPALGKLAAAITITPDARQSFASARLVARLTDGREHTVDVPVAKGHPGNPLSWADMAEKFDGLVTPALGKNTASLLAAVRRFGEPGTLSAVRRYLTAGGLG